MDVNEQTEKTLNPQRRTQGAERQKKEGGFNLKDVAMFGAEMLPGVGEALALKRTSDALDEKDYVGSGIEATAGLLGLVPGVGDAAGKALRATTRKLRKDAKLKIDNPGFDEVYQETYSETKQRASDKVKNEAIEAGKTDTYEANIGTSGGVTGYANSVTFTPNELKDLPGAMGEEKFRSSGKKLDRLKKSIAEKGYDPKDNNILIHVREDGQPFIVEGNHRLAEAVESGRETITADIRYLRGAEEKAGPLDPKNIFPQQAPVRQGYNPEDPASRVFHLTKKDYDVADVIGSGTSDIGFHVGTAAQATARGSTNIKYRKELAEQMAKGERILPMVLKSDLKPARIPDVSSFKEPMRWIADMSVARSDKARIRYLLQNQSDADLLAKAPRVTVGGNTYYMLPDVMRIGMDKELWTDIIREASRARRINLDTINNQEDRIQWFNTLKDTANKHGYDSFVYRNEYEGTSEEGLDKLVEQIRKAERGEIDPEEIDMTARYSDSYMLLEPDQAKGLFGGMTEGEPAFMKNKGGLMMQEGGAVPMAKQMNLFEDGGMKDQGNTIDPVSGNDVPVGSLQEEVRDDIPAQLSEGEFVMPADVVRYHGLDKMMALRDEAKAGLARMEAMGQMGNSEEATIPDGIPFNMDDLDIDNENSLQMQTGGLVPDIPVGINPPRDPFMPPVNPPSGGYQPPQQTQVPIAPAPSVLPAFNQYITPPQTQTVEYINPTTGEKRVFTFINGSPTVPIPEGFIPVSQYQQPESTKPELTTKPQIDPNKDNDPPGPNEAQEKIKERIAAAKSLGYTKQQTTGEALLSLLPFGSDTPERGTILANGNIADGQGNSFDPITGKQAGFLGITNLGKGDNKVTPQMMELGVTPASTAGLRTKAGDASISNVLDASKDGPLPEITDSARVETAQVTAEEGTAAGAISPAVQAKAEELGMIIRNALNLNEEDGMDFLVTLAEGPANQKAIYNSAPETMVNFNEYDSEHREAAKILLENIEEKGNTSIKNLLRDTRANLLGTTSQDEEKGPDAEANITRIAGAQERAGKIRESFPTRSESLAQAQRDEELRKQQQITAEATRIANEAAAAKAVARQQRDDNESPFENQTSYSIGSGGGSRTIRDDAGGGYETGRGFFADGGLAAKKKPKPKKMKRGGLASKK